MKRIFTWLAFLSIGIACTGCGNGCDRREGAVSRSGVSEAYVKVHTDSDGHTVEQKNIMERLTRDNAPGSIKHLYVISAYSGQVLIYSTVRGKVTSSGKRLSPTSVISNGETRDSRYYFGGIPVKIGNTDHLTTEVLQDDGSYGSSGEYLYWFTADGRYFQTYLSGGNMVMVSDQPLSPKSVTINLETSKTEDKK